MDTYVYEFGSELYINLTNQCQNRCSFCIRDTADGLGTSDDLWLSHEPSAQEVIEKLAPHKGRDVVFCGYGEPTMRFEVLKEVAAYVKANGGRVRVNTNGLANLHYGRNIVPEFAKYVDYASISLNAPSAERYDELCSSDYGLDAYGAMLDFTKLCKEAGMETRLTVVGFSITPDEIEACRAIAEKMGVAFRVR